MPERQNIILCSDGTGTWLAAERSQQTLIGLTFTWNVFHGLGDRWNRPRLNLEPDEDVFDVGGDAFSRELAPPIDEAGTLRWFGFGGGNIGAFATARDITVFDSAGCD